MINKKLFTIITVLMFCIGIASALSITVENTTETSIVWNLSQLSGVSISTIAFDGIMISGWYPNVSYLVQNNLYPSEVHIVTVIDSVGVIYTGQAKTLDSQQTWTWTQINTWIYLGFIITLMVIALVVRRNPVLCSSLNLLAAAISLYALYLWMDLNPNQTTDIQHLPFFVYLFFIVFPLAAIIFEKKGR